MHISGTMCIWCVHDRRCSSCLRASASAKENKTCVRRDVYTLVHMLPHAIISNCARFKWLRLCRASCAPVSLGATRPGAKLLLRGPMVDHLR